MRMLASAVAISILLQANPVSSQALSEIDRKAIVEDVIRHFRENPSELVDAIVDWREKETRKLEGNALPAPVSGNPAGDVTVFEFADYGCEPCREAAKSLDDAVAADGKVMVVHHDYPVSTEDAVAAAMDIVSASAAGADWTKMRRIYLDMGPAPEVRIVALSEAGLTPDARSADAMLTLENNRKLAERVGVSELPAMIIASGNKLQTVSGQVTAATLAAAFKTVRDAAARD